MTSDDRHDLRAGPPDNKCPKCGSELESETVDDYGSSGSKWGGVRIYCTNPKCDYETGV